MTYDETTTNFYNYNNYIKNQQNNFDIRIKKLLKTYSNEFSEKIIEHFSSQYNDRFLNSLDEKEANNFIWRIESIIENIKNEYQTTHDSIYSSFEYYDHIRKSSELFFDCSLLMLITMSPMIMILALIPEGPFIIMSLFMVMGIISSIPGLICLISGTKASFIKKEIDAELEPMLLNELSKVKLN